MTQRVPLLANDYVAVFTSPDPANVFTYTPGILRLPSGRLVATLDLGGPGVKNLPGVKATQGEGPNNWQGKIFTSDDGGQSWRWRSDFPFFHARPFLAGGMIYVLGHAGDLQIIRSDDEGETWSAPVALTQDQWWHQSACSVVYARNRVYLVMERRTDPKFPTWPVSVLAPVVLAADVDADLGERRAWTFSNEITYREAVGEPVGVGAPFYPYGLLNPGNPTDRRTMAPIGWLETNLVQFHDPRHLWHDPAGRTFYLWMRAHTGSTNLAAIARATESPTGEITVELAKAPSGQTIVYVPCPGGHLKFDILYDEPSGLYWLLSSQSTDSMTRPDQLPAERFGLPNNERHRLALHYSKNCFDWQMAGLVAVGDSPRQARHYASLTVDGDDLLVLSRSGDGRAKSAHDGNVISFHRVRDFRSLVY